VRLLIILRAAARLSVPTRRAIFRASARMLLISAGGHPAPYALELIIVSAAAARKREADANMLAAAAWFVGKTRARKYMTQR